MAQKIVHQVLPLNFVVVVVDDDDDLRQVDDFWHALGVIIFASFFSNVARETETNHVPLIHNSHLAAISARRCVARQNHASVKRHGKGCVTGML